MANKLLNIIISLSFIVSVVFACTGNCYEPIANAGENVAYYQGSTVVLDGSASYDPDGTEVELTYIWTVPSGIELIDSGISMPSFVASSISDSCCGMTTGCSLDTDDMQYTYEDCMDNNGIWMYSDGDVDYGWMNIVHLILLYQKKAVA